MSRKGVLYMRKGRSYVLITLTVIAYVLISLVVLALLSLVALLIVELLPYIQRILTAKLPTTTDVTTAIATLVTGIVTAFGVAVAIIAGFYARKQVLTSQGIAQGDFLLRLDAAFVAHKDIHAKLRFGGVYPGVVDALDFPKDWPAIESYMGLFERIQVLVEEKIIDIDVVDRMYGYRLYNIINNPIIHEEKFVKLGNGWRDFIKLWKALGDLEMNKNKTQPNKKILGHLRSV